MKKILNPIALVAIVVSLLFVGLSRCKNDTVTRGNEVVVSLGVEPTRGLSPVLIGGDSYGRQVAERHLFMTLSDFNPTTGEWQPVLVKTNPVITETATGQTFTYELLEEAVWDNGHPITAADYIFTVKAILNPKSNASTFRGFVECITDIAADAKNPKKFTVTTNKKFILTEATLGGIAIYPEYFYDAKNLMRTFSIADLLDKKKAMAKDSVALNTFADDFNNKHNREKGTIVGCGPYELESWVSKTSITLTKKKNWWGDKLAASNIFFVAKPEKLTYKIYADPKTAIEALKAGDIDVMAQIAPTDFVALQKDTKFLEKNEIYSPVASYNTYIELNTRNPKLADKRVRQALASLVDVNGLIKNTMLGLAEPSATIFLPSKDYTDKSITTVPLDVEKAKQLLKDAGWIDSNSNGTVDKKINGKLTELSLDFEFSPKQRIEIPEMLKENAKKAGIEINVSKKDAAVFKEDLAKRTYEIAIMTTSADPSLDDPEQRWHTKMNLAPSGNETGFGNAKTDALIAQIGSTFDKTKRDVLYKQLQQAIAAEQPAIFLYVQKERIAASKRFGKTTPGVQRPYIFEQYYELKK
jgi:peptide/nickel transport system substrate-binding protein